MTVLRLQRDGVWNMFACLPEVIAFLPLAVWMQDAYPPPTALHQELRCAEIPDGAPGCRDRTGVRARPALGRMWRVPGPHAVNAIHASVVL